MASRGKELDPGLVIRRTPEPAAERYDTRNMRTPRSLREAGLADEPLRESVNVRDDKLDDLLDKNVDRLVLIAVIAGGCVLAFLWFAARSSS